MNGFAAMPTPQPRRGGAASLCSRAALRAMPPRDWAWSSWLLAIIGTVLALDGLALLLIKGMTSLGVVFPLVLGAALIGLVVWRPALRAWVSARPWRRWAWRATCAVSVLWLLSVAVFFGQLAQQPTGAAAFEKGAHASTAPPVRAVIVLGSGTPKGVVSPTLQARLDTALALAQQWPQAVVAVSGGVDFGETRSEGQVMGDYLRAQGLPTARIVQEEASTSTDLNFKLTQPLLAARGVALTDPVVVVSSDFHLPRVRAIAQRQGWQQVHTVGAPTPLYLRYNAWLREYFALLSSRVLGEV